RSVRHVRSRLRLGGGCGCVPAAHQSRPGWPGGDRAGEGTGGVARAGPGLRPVVARPGAGGAHAGDTQRPTLSGISLYATANYRSPYRNLEDPYVMADSTLTGRVLLVGKRARILDQLADDRTRLGLHVREETDVERARTQIDGATVDVVAVGRAIKPGQRE